MNINWLCLIAGLYRLIICFYIKKKHKLDYALSGKYLIKAETVKDRNKLEFEVSILELIFGTTLIIISIIEEPTILLKILLCIIVGFHIFKSFYIRKKILNGYYD